MKRLRLILILFALVFTTSAFTGENRTKCSIYMRDILSTPCLDSTFVSQLDKYQLVQDSFENAQVKQQIVQEVQTQKKVDSVFFYSIPLYFLCLYLLWVFIRTKLTEEDRQLKKIGRLKSFNANPRMTMKAYIFSLFPYITTIYSIEEYLAGSTGLVYIFLFTLAVLVIYVFFVLFLYGDHTSYYAITDEGIHHVVQGKVAEKYKFQDISDVQLTSEGKNFSMTITLTDGRVLDDWNTRMYKDIRNRRFPERGKQYELSNAKKELKKYLPAIVLAIVVPFLLPRLFSTDNTDKFGYVKQDLKGGNYYGPMERIDKTIYRHGFGRMSWDCGDVYEGQFNKNKRTGLGRFKRSSIEYYVGDVKDLTWDGYGIRYYADSVFYCGQFATDKRSGYGISYLPSCHFYYMGFWRNDNLVLDGMEMDLKTAYLDLCCHESCVYHFNDSVFVIADKPQTKPYKIVREVINSVKLATDNQRALDSIMHDFPKYTPLPSQQQFHMTEFLSKLLDEAKKR